MAFTLTTLKQAIQDYTESNETTFVNNLTTIITQAEDKILKAVQLPDFRKNVAGSVASGNQYLIMPTDFLTPYSLAIDNSGFEYLMFKDVNFIRQAYPLTTTQGAPKYYGIFSRTAFILGPTLILLMTQNCTTSTNPPLLPHLETAQAGSAPMQSPHSCMAVLSRRTPF